MGICDSFNKNQNYDNDLYNFASRQVSRQTIKYFPENTKKGNLTLNNDVIISNSGKDPDQVYQRIQLLGEGGYGQVWKVRNIYLGKDFAMKIIKTKKKGKITCGEIVILKRLDHPNILKILDFYSSSDEFFIVTEYCPEGELSTEIKKRGSFTEPEAAFVLYQILSAIRYCHKMRVIHEDLKPENIMITKRDKDNYLYIKIIDFGTAKIFKEGNMLNSFVGTVYYMAPEVIEGAYNELSDIWSIGVIMYYMLIGSRPFDGKNNGEILDNVKLGKYCTSSPNYLNLSENAKDLISKLLEYDPSKRISARDALNHPWFNNPQFKELINTKNSLDLNEKLQMLQNLENYRNVNLIKTAALAYLVHQNTDIVQCQDVIKLFYELDSNHDGKIEPYELAQAYIKYYNIDMTEAKKKVKSIFEELDLEKTGFIDGEDFIRGCLDPRLFNSPTFIDFAFNYFDEDRSGFISIEELQKKFLQSAKNQSNKAKKELKNFFKSIDGDGDGYISSEEFTMMMKNIINN